MPWFSLIWRYRKLIAYGLISLALVWFVWSRIHAYGDRRAQEIVDRWQIATADINKATEAANAAARQKEGEATARNEVIERDYIQKVAAAESERDRTLRLLQSARATSDAVRAGQVAGYAKALGASEAGRDQALRRAADLDAAIADLRKEAGQNADQLDSLIAEVKPQIIGDPVSR